MESHSQYAILASGQGSNAKALVEQGVASAHLPKVIVVTNKNSNLRSLCNLHGILFIEIFSSQKGIDLDFEEELFICLKEQSIDWIFMAGFLKILSGDFLSKFKSFAKGEVLNIHPSLLPSYPGLGGYKNAYENKDDYYGHTIHLVDEEVDGGPHILQMKLAANLELTFEEYIEAGKLEENKSYAHVLELLLQGDLKLEI